MPSRRLPDDHPEQRRRRPGWSPAAPRAAREGSPPASPPPPPPARPARSSVALRLTRYGLPGAILLAGVVFAIAVPGERGLDVLVGLGGVCACVVVLNLLLRLGISGDRDRDREAAAREFYDRHGRWPDDRRPTP